MTIKSNQNTMSNADYWTFVDLMQTARIVNRVKIERI